MSYEDGNVNRSTRVRKNVVMPKKTPRCPDCHEEMAYDDDEQAFMCDCGSTMKFVYPELKESV